MAAQQRRVVEKGSPPTLLHSAEIRGNQRFQSALLSLFTLDRRAAAPLVVGLCSDAEASHSPTPSPSLSSHSHSPSSLGGSGVRRRKRGIERESAASCSAVLFFALDAEGMRIEWKVSMKAELTMKRCAHARNGVFRRLAFYSSRDLLEMRSSLIVSLR